MKIQIHTLSNINIIYRTCYMQPQIKGYSMCNRRTYNLPRSICHTLCPTLIFGIVYPTHRFLHKARHIIPIIIHHGHIVLNDPTTFLWGHIGTIPRSDRDGCTIHVPTPRILHFAICVCTLDESSSDICREDYLVVTWISKFTDFTEN